MGNLEQILSTYSVNVLYLGAFFLVLFAFISVKKKHLSAAAKKTLFLGVVASALVPTLVMAGTTIYLNVISSSQGPVHWHADFEVYACGKELNLKDPQGLSNKIGTATLHEHNDKRIHLEGVVLQHSDASLGEFFHVVGGNLTSTGFSFPTNEGISSYQNGDACPTGSGEAQVFVYRTDGDQYYSQEKVSDPAKYIISPESNVPAGDCVIIEFDTPKSRTDKLCRSYKVAKEIGKLKGEK
jgi:hypothetical protein